MRTRIRGEDVIITVHTSSNRSKGVFLMFLGLCASWPMWYIAASWLTHAPKSWEDWYPALYVCAGFTSVGFFLGLLSNKTIAISPTSVRVTDGPLHRALTFPREAGQSIRLQSILSERNERPETTWLVKLVAGRHEYLLDERVGRQLESRCVAEGVARALGCSFREKDDEGVELTFSAADLDLPYVERVKRYPSLIGRAVAAPPRPGVTRVEKEGRLEFSWGIVTPSLLLSMLALGLVFFVVSAIPQKAGHMSYLERAHQSGSYHLYYLVGTVIVAALVFSAGYRLRLRLTPKGVYLQKSIWGIPMVGHTLKLCQVEEVQMAHTVRGPVVQVLGDSKLIEFQASDADVAQWLAHEIRVYLAAPGLSCA